MDFIAWYLRFKRRREVFFSLLEEERLLIAEEKHMLTAQTHQVKKRRASYRRSNYTESVWGKTLEDQNLLSTTENNRARKLFRRRYRVPIDLFQTICTLWKASTGNDINKIDAFRRSAAPIPLKVMTVLRVCGRALTFDDCCEFSGVSENTLRCFFHTFCKHFASDNYKAWVKGPETEEEISYTTGVYKMLGFPGCIGSCDVVHVPWDCAPAMQRNMFVGKEGYPTIAFEVTVDHTTKIMGCTVGHYGSRNDKTIVRFDGFIRSIVDRQKYGDVQFKLRTSPDSSITEIGVYIIVDGGYHLWRVLQCPYKIASEEAEVWWSKALESVRKDVERTFGIMKKRFRMLKMPMLFRDMDDISYMFFTLCILHNMLLRYDGRDLRWVNEVFREEDEEQYSSSDDEIIDEEEENHLRAREARVRDTLDRTRVGREHFGENQQPNFYSIGDTETDTNFYDLRRMLVQHFKLEKEDGNIRWLH